MTLIDRYFQKAIEQGHEPTKLEYKNATELLSRVDTLIKRYNKATKKNFISVITSGYRTLSHNAKIGGAKASYHSTGEAVDLLDNELQELANWYALQDKAFFQEIGLSLENPLKTKGKYTNWCHLDLGKRNRGGEMVYCVFMP